MDTAARVLGIDGRVLTGPQVGLFHFLAPILARLPWRWPGRVVVFLPAPLPPSVSLPPDVERIVLGASERPPMLRWLARDLPKALRAHPVDVFWSPHHFLPFGLHAPGVVTVHDLIWKTTPSDLRWVRRAGEERLLGWAMQRANVVTTVSKATRDVLVAAFPGCAGKSEVVHPGVPDFPPSTEPSDALHEWTRGRYVLAVGARQPRKNLPRLVEAFRSLDAAKHRGWSLIVVGGTAWGDPFADVAPCSNIAMSGELPVVFAGGVARGELRWLYEHASAFATASLDEGFGLPLIEAERFGLPRIASDIPVFREIAGEGTAFFDPRDVRAITDALDRMIVRASRDEGTRERAVRDVERFSWDRTVARLAELAAAAASERRRP